MFTSDDFGQLVVDLTDGNYEVISYSARGGALTVQTPDGRFTINRETCP